MLRYKKICAKAIMLNLSTNQYNKTELENIKQISRRKMLIVSQVIKYAK